MLNSNKIYLYIISKLVLGAVIMQNENVIGYIDNLTAFGIIAPIRRSLVITDQRILILDSGSISSTATSVGFAYIFGIFGRSISNRISREEIEEVTKKLSQANFDELIKSNPDNIGLENMSIKSVEISRKWIHIITAEKTFKYKLSNPNARNKKSDVYEHYVKTLQFILGSKVILK